MSQAQDMAAIKNFFDRTTAKNTTASGLKSSFLGWYGGLNIVERNFSDSVLTEAKSRRDGFNRANATPGVAPAPSQVAAAIGIIPPGPMPTIKKATRKTNDKNAVIVWQKYLASIGLYSGAIDGDFYTKSHDATVKYQKARKDVTGVALKADGEVGPKTWGTAQKESIGVMTTPTSPAVAAQQAVVAASTPKPIPTPQAVTNTAVAAAAKANNAAKPTPKPKTPAVTVATKAPAATKAAAQQAAKNANAKLPAPIATAGMLPQIDVSATLAAAKLHATNLVNEFHTAPTAVKATVGGLALLSAFLGIKELSKMSRRAA